MKTALALTLALAATGCASTSTPGGLDYGAAQRAFSAPTLSPRLGRLSRQTCAAMRTVAQQIVDARAKGVTCQQAKEAAAIAAQGYNRFTQVIGFGAVIGVCDEGRSPAEVEANCNALGLPVTVALMQRNGEL